MSRLVSDVDAEADLYCSRCDTDKPAKDFVTGGPNKSEPGRSLRYRAYCKECHRTRNGRTNGPELRRAGHITRPGEARDPEVEAALGVLRDHRAQKRGRQGYVYCIGEGPTGGWAVKVGYSVKPEARAGELQTGNPRVLHLLGKFEGTEADERALHAKYVKYNLIGEWFVATPELLGEFGLNAAGQPKERTLAAA